MKGKTSEELTALREKHVPRGPYNITPLFLESARGALLKDIEGKEYIDFAGGIGTENLGHSQETVVNAVKEQADRFLHNCFHVTPYESYVELAKRLNESSPGNFDKKTFFCELRC